MSKILVIGATGHVGRPLIRDLIARGEQVKAASRSGAPVEGAEGVAFDIAKPDLTTLFAGVDRLFLLLPGGYADSKGLLLPIVQAAAARKVKIVFMSALGVDADDSIATERSQHLHSCASSTTKIDRRANRLGLANQRSDKTQQRIRRAKRGVVKLWRE